MAGAKIRRIMVWVPQSGDIGVGVSILSYAGGVQFGLITDKRLCPEPQRIIDRFEPEFEKLVLALCLLPWEQPVDPDEAESWLFPSVSGPAPATPSGKVRQPAKRRTKRARPAEPATKPSAEGEVPIQPAVEESAPARPAGLRRRRSAFAAARASEEA
jgi:hypothetical protein